MAERLSDFYPLGIAGDGLGRTHYRMRNHVSRMRLDLVDDTGPAQLWQAEGYPSELRTGLQVVVHEGFGGVPLPNAEAIVLFQGGHRGFGTIIGTEDGRYRARGFKPGERHVSMVDGAAADGTGGTLRMIVKGLLGWATSVLGKSISIGDADNVSVVIGSNGNTTTVDVYAKTQVTVHTPLAEVTNGGTPHFVLTNGGSGVSTVLKADS